MILYELGNGFRPIPIVCVRDTKVGKFLGLGRFVEKVWWMLVAVVWLKPLTGFHFSAP
jgi:hypothetical protein